MREGGKRSRRRASDSTPNGGAGTRAAIRNRPLPRYLITGVQLLTTGSFNSKPRHRSASRVIHVICDNARMHTAEGSKLVRAYLKEWGHRVKVHYLPKYSPDTNPIERVWWRLHEAVTRNHRCHTIDQLLDLTFDWFETRTHFRVESSVYTKSPGK